MYKVFIVFGLLLVGGAVCLLGDSPRIGGSIAVGALGFAAVRMRHWLAPGEQAS